MLAVDTTPQDTITQGTLLQQQQAGHGAACIPECLQHTPSPLLAVKDHPAQHTLVCLYKTCNT
jgi:hypothetical protein